MSRKKNGLRERAKKQSRKRNPMAYIFVEGGRTNKTERIFLNDLNQCGEITALLNVQTQTVTDLGSMLAAANKIVREADFKNNSEDRVFCLVDTDCDEAKWKQIEKLYRANHNDRIVIVLSHPCMEFWYLLHFIYTDKTYQNSDDVAADLKRYIPEYQKNKSCFEYLKGRIEITIRNSEMLYRHCPEEEVWEKVLFHSGTMMPEFLEMIGFKPLPVKYGDEMQKRSK